MQRARLRFVESRLFRRQIVIKVGSVLSMERVFTRNDIEAFSNVSCDKNPLHFEKEAVDPNFPGPVVHGMLVASMFSAIVGNSIPGSIYLTQNFKWAHPVYAGDIVVARVEVLKLKKFRDAMIASMKTTCKNQDEVLIIDGRAMCKLPQSSAENS